MKSRPKKMLIIITIFLICISFINPLNKSKKLSSRTKNKFGERKQFNQIQQSNMISQIGRTDSTYRNNNSKDAVTYGLAGSQLSLIPENHPIMTNLKSAKYVERLRYFDDAPTLRNYEANTIDKLEEDYYKPFQTRNLRRILATSNCDTFTSPFSCQASALCGWDAKLIACYMRTTSPQIDITNRNYFSFKEKARNSNHNNINNMSQ